MSFNEEEDEFQIDSFSFYFIFKIVFSCFLLFVFTQSKYFTHFFTTCSIHHKIISFFQIHSSAIDCMNFSYSDIPSPNCIYSNFSHRWQSFQKMKSVSFDHKVTHCFAYQCGTWSYDPFLKEFHNKSIYYFGPFVPCFTNWFLLQRFEPHRRWNRLQRLYSVFDPQTLMLTLIASDKGLGGGNYPYEFKNHRNMFVLSTAAYHVPIPMILMPLSPLPYIKPKFHFAFFGSVYYFRVPLFEYLKKKLGANLYLGSGQNWIEFSRRVEILISPRGYGRQTFRHYEIIDLRLVPFFIDDIHTFHPYENSTLLWNQIAFFGKWQSIGKDIQVGLNSSSKQLNNLRRISSRYHYSHFTFEALIDQIQRMMLSWYDDSDLRCKEFTDPNFCGPEIPDDN